MKLTQKTGKQKRPEATLEDLIRLPAVLKAVYQEMRQEWVASLQASATRSRNKRKKTCHTKNEARSVLIATRVSTADNKLIQATIKRSGLKQSEWARKALLQVASDNTLITHGGTGGN